MMFRSRFLWKLYAGYVLLILLNTGIVSGLVALDIDSETAVLLGAAIAAVVALGFGFIYARRVTRPLLSMASAAQAIASGDYGRRVQGAARDELGVLAAAFNTMSHKLRVSIENLNADRGKLEAMLASMVEGVVAIDRGERIVHMNAAAGRMLGVHPEPALGRHIWEVTRVREVSEVLSAVLERREVIHHLLRLPGSPDRFFDLHSSPLNADGDRAGAVMVLEDVTQARRLDTLRRDFLGNVSHELKTPVTAIRGLIETVLEDPKLERKTRERFLVRIGQQAVRLSHLVTDLLSLTRLESDQELLEREWMDVREALEAAVRSVEPAERLRVRTEIPDEPVVIDGDHEALRQAVSNLIANAIKYSNGSVVHVRLLKEEESAVVEVEDDGIGIEPKHLERIFERFYRVDKARSRELGGTGLGLAIVKHIALAHGGEVSLDSRLGEGSRFRIRLPLAVEVEAETETGGVTAATGS